jgi:hypothetical protein
MPVANKEYTKFTPNPTSENANSPEKQQQQLDPNDPRVKKLVYSMYRDMLGSYHGDANNFIRTKDPSTVRIDYGITPILECIM